MLQLRLKNLRGLVTIRGSSGAARACVRGYVWHQGDDCYHLTRVLKVYQRGLLCMDEAAQELWRNVDPADLHVPLHVETETAA